ncbi:tRNA(Glu)-specific nuclease WapA precursor [compost metagenome]
MYYLQSRYYNSEFGRFINEDAIVSTGQGLLAHNMFAYCNNNPVNRHDSSGHFAWFLPLIIPTIVMAIIAIPIVNAIVKDIIAPVVTQVINTTTQVVNNVVNDVKDKVNKKLQKNNTVYRLTDPNTGNTKYVGRTINPTARSEAHKADLVKTDLRFEIVKSGLNYYEARGLEQIMMVEYNTKSYLNRINGISPKNNNLGKYMEAGRQVANYLGNYISNEALYWTGQ